MRLLGRNILHELHGRDVRTDKWLVSWAAEVRDANWKHAEDVLKQFPHVRHGEPDYFVFRVGGSNTGVKLTVMFPLGIAVVSYLELDTEKL